MGKITKTVPYSFDELFSESRNLFANAGFDTSDGSNTSQLAAVMSYMISALNTNTALNINETLLPYATKRKNILQDARVLGYEAKHKTSYQYRINIRLHKKMCGYGTLTIPKFFCIEANGHTYYFFGNANANTAYANTDLKVNLGSLVINDKEIIPDALTFLDNKNEEIEDRFLASTVKYNNTDVTQEWEKVKKTFVANRNVEIVVKEGELISYEKDVASLSKTIGSVTQNGENYVRNYVDIPYTDVENDGIECLVSYFDNSGNYQQNVLFTETTSNFFEIDGDQFLNRNYIRQDDIEMGTPRLYFRYAGMGSGLPFGSVVNMNILITSGSEGSMGDLNYSTVSVEKDTFEIKEDSSNENFESVLSYTNLSIPTIASDNNAISDVFDESIVTACDLVKTGTDEETNASIQETAPKVYNSAHRLVTNLDYKAACNRSTYVLDSSVWGGEDEFPKSPGHIWFSFLPEKTSERGFSANEGNTEYQRNASKLVYNYKEGETKYQYALRQDYYNRNYILNTEIKSYSIYRDQNGPQLKYSGVWGDLINQYVPSLTFHHRHPIYLNFNYNFEILKYNVKQTTAETHDTLFNALDNCFFGNDSLNLENFDIEYFHSNIVKRIDYLISDLCGFTSTVSNQLVLNEKTLCSENWDSSFKDIYIPLCVPFEKYFDNQGFLDTDRLPKIDTERFIDYRFDSVLEPYTYDGNVEGKYDSLRYSIVRGDLFVDWERIKLDQLVRRQKLETSTDDTDYSDTSTKAFVAPVKIKMTYIYRCTKEFINGSDNYLTVGFLLAPENIKDESFNNIKLKVFDNYNEDAENIPSKEFNSDNFRINYKYRNRLMITDTLKNYLKEGNIIEIEFERSCGYYYLFNSFKKEILVHLFVNGENEGFKVAETGMRTNEYYDHHLDEMNSVWNKQEKDFDDESNFIDITYTTPRSYFYTTDKRYLCTNEPIGDEMEEYPHLFNYDNNMLPSVTNEKVKELFEKGKTADEIFKELGNEIAKDFDDRSDPEELNSEDGNHRGHYLTSEGYIITDGDTGIDQYTGPVVRAYNKDMYYYTPLTVDLFKQNVYMNLSYPSENFKVHRNVIPRLNNVKFKNATNLY
jgi:hypothetical protein